MGLWIGLLVWSGCVRDSIPVGATLKDGQVLVGAISTATLDLEGGLGTVRIPLEDVGLLVPVEGSTLADSHGHVDVWLRNGSELRGRWTDPELQMALQVGRGQVSVTVPTGDLQALQLRGAEEWADGPIYRVRTNHGDDFLVDPAATQVHLENALGAFAPFLSECASIGPVGSNDGDWRVELQTGTVLVGRVTEAALTFALPMGPDVVEVPLDALVSLSQGGWIPRDGISAPPTVTAELAAAEADPAEATGGGGGSAIAAPAKARPALSSAAGWFDNRSMDYAKH